MTEAGATLFVEVTNIKIFKGNTKNCIKLNFVNEFGIVLLLVRVFNVKISKFSRGK